MSCVGGAVLTQIPSRHNVKRTKVFPARGHVRTEDQVTNHDFVFSRSKKRICNSMERQDSFGPHTEKKESSKKTKNKLHLWMHLNVSRADCHHGVRAAIPNLHIAHSCWAQMLVYSNKAQYLLYSARNKTFEFVTGTRPWKSQAGLF